MTEGWLDLRKRAAQGSKSHIESRGLYTPPGYSLGSTAKTPSDQGVLVEVTGFEPATSTMRTCAGARR